ncbi:MAG: MaoC/PaaZ C-terminal domain-containing protein [Acidimicrobiales bacterium]
MPVPSAAVGVPVEVITHEVTARWLMAYAAALDDYNPAYLDTRRPGGVVGHPLFPVCVEWDSMLAARRLPLYEAVLSADEARRGVHATHDSVVHRLVRAGDVLTTHAEVVGVEARKPGVYTVLRETTVDAAGEVVCVTDNGSLYLGVELDGPARPAPPLAPPAPGPPSGAAPVHERRVSIARGAAHTYTECAQIWNPIHTDIAVAEAAALPELILHGTATLAHGVTTVVDEACGGDPALVRRVSARFTAMVLMPSTITVRLYDRVEAGDGVGVPFEVLTENGERAISAGFVGLNSPS